MRSASRTGLLAAALAAMPAADGKALAHVLEADSPPFALPKSAYGNGYRGSGGNKYHEPRPTKRRRRKLALASKRRNRR